MKKYFKLAAFSVLGGALGFAYYYFVGCSNGGSCPLTSHWYITTGYGMAAGIIAAFPVKASGEKRT